MNFGGGPGTYLTSLQNLGVRTLVTVEPHPLGGCLFANLTKDDTNWVNVPLLSLPSKRYDLVMTIEVLESISAAHHKHVVLALAQATTKWLLFSATVVLDGGGSKKIRQQWTKDIQQWTDNRLVVDESKTKMFHEGLDLILQERSIIFERYDWLLPARAGMTHHR